MANTVRVSNAERTASDPLVEAGSTASPVPPAVPGPPAGWSLSALAIEGFLAWRVVRTGREMERALTDSIAEHELTTTQFGVLALLATGADFNQSELARAVLVRPQSMGTLITSLTERGLMSRRGPGGRGRRAYFDLTEAGRGLIENAWSQVTARHCPTRLGLDEEDAQTLDRLLQTLESAASEAGT